MVLTGLINIHEVFVDRNNNNSSYFANLSHKFPYSTQPNMSFKEMFFQDAKSISIL